MKTFIHFTLIFFFYHLNVVSQNIGIGTTNPQAKLDVVNSFRVGGNLRYIAYDSLSGKLGIINGYLGVNTTTARFPLSFGNATGSKISLWDDGNTAGANYGLGVINGQLRIHTYTASDDIVLGYGSTESLTERFRFKGNGGLAINGNLGIAGQVLRSNGNASSSSWEFPVKTYWWGISLIDDFSSTTDVSVFSQSVAPTTYSSLIITVFLALYSDPCFGCTAGKGYASVYIDGNFVTGFRLYSPPDNSSLGNSLPNFILNVGAGNHTIEVKVRKTTGSSDFDISGDSYVSVVSVAQ